MNYHHPDWYYSLYNDLFNWSRNNEKIVSIINENRRINSSVIEEIGSGTGSFIDAILIHAPRLVFCTDIDCISIRLLKEKYNEISNIKIIHQDGFTSVIKSDIIVCLYSIIQQTYEISTLKKRIDNLLERAKSNRTTLFIEIIDTSIHKPHGNLRIYSRENDYVDIASTPMKNGIRILYTGEICGQQIEYCVPIHQCPTELFLKPDTSLSIYSLNESHRKKLICVDCR